ncbi:hypothetical protein VNO80_02829 [Phaseolus coccineus]|uniref:Uncharacterized protein n=1 Tax=Phaseolus coccineus TaxID=3886 RepID=A0AAN9RI97_PHACN
MEPARVTIDLDDYEISEKQTVPDSGDFRLERRWKRRELSNKREKHNHHDSGTISTIKSCGNVAILSVQEGHMSEDEMDEDYKLFLVTYNPHPQDTDVVSDGNVDGSDNDINMGYDSVHYDLEYRMFLEEERFHNDPKLDTELMKGSKQRYETRKDGSIGSDSVRKQLSGPIKSQPNLEAKRRLSKKRPREDVSIVPKNNCHAETKGSKQRDETGNQAYKGSDSVQKQTSYSLKSHQNLEAKRGHSKKRPLEDVSGVPKNSCHTEMMKGAKQSSEFGNKGSYSVRKQTRVTLKSQQNLETIRGLSKKRPYEDASVVPENNCHSNTELDVEDEDYRIFLNSCMDDYIRSELMRNSQVSEHVLSEVDEDYLQYLNSLRIVDDEVECLPERNTSKTDMPKRNTTKTDMPGKNTSKTDNTDMPKRNTAKTDLPGKNTSKTDMPKRIVTKTDMPGKNTSKTDLPRMNTLETDMPQRKTLESGMPDRNTSKTEMPERNTLHTDMPERNISNTDIPERNISNTVNVDGDNNSSEPDLILLEPDQIHENTPFVSSKTYDSSWFETEMNLKDNWQLSAYDHSQFRRRLMNDLQRPYDQEECDRLLLEVRQKRKKERHIETRQGVVKSYCTKGVNKSYLELYPDLAKAIAKFKQPERVLFILRGFIFWLQNLTHEGIFRPWPLFLKYLCQHEHNEHNGTS